MDFCLGCLLKYQFLGSHLVLWRPGEKRSRDLGSRIQTKATMRLEKAWKCRGQELAGGEDPLSL